MLRTKAKVVPTGSTFTASKIKTVDVLRMKPYVKINLNRDTNHLVPHFNNKSTYRKVVNKYRSNAMNITSRILRKRLAQSFFVIYFLLHPGTPH